MMLKYGIVLVCFLGYVMFFLILQRERCGDRVVFLIFLEIIDSFDVRNTDVTTEWVDNKDKGTEEERIWLCEFERFKG